MLTLTFFNQAWRERDLRPGRWGLFAGKVTEFRGKRQLNGPDYMLLGDEGEASEEIECADRQSAFRGGQCHVSSSLSAGPSLTG